MRAALSGRKPVAVGGVLSFCSTWCRSSEFAIELRRAQVADRVRASGEEVSWHLLHELTEAFAFRLEFLWGRAPQLARRASVLVRMRDLGIFAVLDDQCTWHDHDGEFGVAESVEHRPHVAIEREFRIALAKTECAAHPNGEKPRVDGTGVKGQQPTLAVADDPQFLPAGAGVLNALHHRLQVVCARAG